MDVDRQDLWDYPPGGGVDVDRQDGWEYPPGGGADVDRKEEGGILPPAGLEGCVRGRASVETSFMRLIFVWISGL